MSELFEQADRRHKGTLEMEDLRTALPEINARLRLELEAADVPRLYAFLKGGSPGPVSYNQFMTGLSELTLVLRKVGPTMTSRQMKTVLVAAFDRFDADHDGSISHNEFLVTAQMLGIKLDAEESGCLYRFFCGEGGMVDQASLVAEPPLWEKWSSLLNRSMEQMKEKYGWTSVEKLGARVQAALSEPGSVQEKADRAMKAAWEGAEDLCDVAELAADAAGLAMAAKYVGDELQEELTTGAIQDLNVMTLAPFAVCLGLFAVNVSKQLDELVPKEMTPDEALLYAQYFKRHGFSQAEFRRVLSCPGCHWGLAHPGDVMNPAGDSRVKLVIKGSMEVANPDSPTSRPGTLLGPGSSVGGVGYLRGREIWHGEVLRVREELAYISWDPEGLRKCVHHDEGLSLKMDALLAGTFAANLRAVLKYRRPKDGRKFRRTAPKLEPLDEDALAGSPLLPGSGDSFETVLDAIGVSCGDSPLSCQHVEAFLRKVDDASSPGTASGLGKRLFEWLDRNGDGQVSCSEFRMQMANLEKCLKVLDGISVREIVGVFTKDKITEEDLKGLMEYVDKTICLGTTSADCQRLFRHVDKNGDGEVTLKELVDSLTELCTCLEALEGLTLKELATLLHRAFQQVDTDSDGKVSVEEFIAAARRLNIPLGDEQAELLHSYLDVDKDGSIDLGEWQSGNSVPKWVEALQASLESQVKRKGFARLGYFAEVMHGIAEGPGDLFAKGKRVMDRLWDASNELADATNLLTDSIGVCAALSGIWQEVSGINSMAEIDDMDLLPFLIFLGISSIKMVRHIAEGQVSDLSEQEALVYATVFQKEGFSVTEFQRLLSYGARWEEIAPGQKASLRGEASALRLVVRGKCVLEDEDGQRVAHVSSGSFLDGLPSQEGSKPLCTAAAARARALTTLLTWDAKDLESHLESDQSLQQKMARFVTISMADRLLSFKEYDTPGAGSVTVRFDPVGKPGEGFFGAQPEKC